MRVSVITRIHPSSSALARRALLITLFIAAIGACLGVAGIAQGVVVGLQIPLVLSCLLFSAFALFTLLVLTSVALQTIATISTIYFAAYLGAGAVLAITGSSSQHFSLFIYLIWFFPLLVFNKLVNGAAVGRLLAKTVVSGPIAIICLSSPRLIAIFPVGFLFVLASFCLSYLGFGLMLGVVTRYREDVVAERERAESLRVETAVLESISDCFLSLDSSYKLVYLNDAACMEFGVNREWALGKPILAAVSGFFSHQMLSGLQAAYADASATEFEAQNERRNRWYEMRCFPRSDGLSIYFRNITDRRAAESQIQHLAFYDALTDLPNRILLKQRLDAALSHWHSRTSIGALLFIDLDDFKTLNDTLGHDAGDGFLKEVARRLLSCVRSNDTVARFGGDEFVVLLDGLADTMQTAATEATAVAQAILAAIAATCTITTNEHSSSAAIGIAFFSGVQDTVDDLLKRADLAMYRAKAKGRDTICIFEPEMRSSIASRAKLQADLRAAMVSQQFSLFYQPQIDHNGGVIGAEALLRWFHPGRGMVSPDEFIPLAEEAGLIIELGRWVLATACRQLAQWAQQPEMEELTIAVNVSLRQFRDVNFVELVLAVLHESGANPRRLKLEITESSAMENINDTIAKMSALKMRGISFSIDDFGTGYSSLSHLKRMPLAQLKIDRSFVNEIATDAKDASIVRTLIALGNDLGLSVIAEGVETRVQRDLLEHQGCNFYQGFLFSKALNPLDFHHYVAAVRTRA